MFLTRRDVPRAEQNRKQDERDAEAQRQHLRRRFLGEDADGFGDREDLQGDVGKGPRQHEKGHQHACGLTAITKGDQIGKRGQLIVADDF